MGEVNVVEKMKEVKAVIGGEGNGGIIYPDLHYGRDALVGIALFLSLLTEKNQKVSVLRLLSDYAMSKAKVSFSLGMDVDTILKKLERKYSEKIPLP